MRSLSGRIIGVQEGRFALATDDGRVLPLMLSRRATAEPQDLGPLFASGARVRVDYEDSPRLVSGVAHRILRED